MQLATVVAAALATASQARGLNMKAASLRGASLDLNPPADNSPKWGHKSCPCIGIAGVNGEFTVQISSNNSDTPFFTQYPAEVGSFCKAWDDGLEPVHCQEGQHPGKGKDWCAQPWCLVDACNCEGISSPPKVSHMLPDVIYEGRRLYYSYSTCGAEDVWPHDDDAHTCVHAETEDACMDLEDCIWGETTWGSKCLGWEAGGFCTDLPAQSQWGDHDCPCVGFGDVNGSLQLTIDDKTVEYPGDLGSICRPWHNDHHFECQGDNPAEWCKEHWCFVDVEHCTVDHPPRESTYLPNAMWNGRRLHYSYATCGGKTPPAPPPPVKEQAAEEDQKEDEDDDKDEDDAEGEDDAEENDEDEDENEGEDEDADEGKSAAITGQEEHPLYDNSAYEKEWHSEWRHGSVPAFRDQYPQAKKFEDRQSDGKASAVPTGLR